MSAFLLFLPNIGESSQLGEIEGLKNIHIVDGACLPVLTEKSHTLSVMANADVFVAINSSTVFWAF
jgi:hypothetical protein